MGKSCYYCGSYSEFLDLKERNRFVNEMKKGAGFTTTYTNSEVESWKANANAITSLLNKSNIPDDVYVAFEQSAPVGGRVDCMLFGKGENGKNNIVLFELKQWDNSVNVCDESPNLITAFTGGMLQDVEHPSMQAHRYHMHFLSYKEMLNGGDYDLTSIAYCYNYNSKGDNLALFAPQFKDIMAQHPLFCRDQEQELAQFVASKLCGGKGEDIYDALVSSPTRQTADLLKSAADLVIDQNDKVFSLLGDQANAFTKIKDILEAVKDNEKKVFIIKGGPGTGKTLLALKLLAETAKMSKQVYYTTRATALKNQLTSELNSKENDKGFSPGDLVLKIYNFRPYRFYENEIDLLIIDEAHRISKSSNDQSGNDGSIQPVVKYNGERAEKVYCPLSQTLSLIYCAKVCVFLIDDHQAVKFTETGNSTQIEHDAKNYSSLITSEVSDFRDSIEKLKLKLQDTKDQLAQLNPLADAQSKKKYSRLLKKEKNTETEIFRDEEGLKNIHSTFSGNVKVEVCTLQTQFRCLGGDRYINWLDQVLYKSPREISYELKKGDYDFKLYDNPVNLYNEICRLNGMKQTVARLVAGWCWEWRSGKNQLTEDGDLKKEVCFNYTDADGSKRLFELPWETNGSHPRGEYKMKYAPSAESWASDSMGINQTGCIYSAQGFEFDYVGVIIGPDLVYDYVNDCLKGKKKNNFEREIQHCKDDNEADRLIRNCYRVLMSRGHKGCYVYCCDPKVADYLRRFMAK